MSKKIIAVLMAAVLLIGGLAACGGKGGSSNFSIPEGGYDGSEVTIKFAHTMGAKLQEVLNYHIGEFNKLYPNITIEHSSYGGWGDIAGLINSTETIKRADGSTETLGLTPDQINDFIAGFYNEGKQFGDGLMYTLPMSKSTEVLYYNKTFFDEHNLSLPSTWDELEALCGQIKAIDPESIPLGYDSEANWFITMCEQYGSPYTSASGDHFLFDNEQNRAFVKEFNEWYQKGYLTTQTLYGSYTSGLFVAKEGTRSYMSIGSSAGATHQRPALVDGAYPFEVGITTIPQVDANNKKVISQGPSLCIFQKDNPQEVIASWLFVKFLTTTVEFQAEFAMASGYVPVLKSVGENPVYADFLAHADGGNYIAALSAKVCLEQEDAYYASPAFNGSSTARDEVGALMAKCLPLTGDVDGKIADAFEEAIEECEYFQ